MKKNKIIRSKAPFRIGIGGGGSDVSPFLDIYGGVVLNATINKYATTTLIPREDNKITIKAYSSLEFEEYDITNELPLNGKLDLQKGVYNYLLKYYKKEKFSFDLITDIDIPSGSGLGTSSTIVVSTIGAFMEYFKLPLGEYEIAALAFDIEREYLQLKGGKQDQFAATFGGFNFIEFYENNRVIVNPLRIKSVIKNELSRCMLLIYTQNTRLSSSIIDDQIKEIQNQNQEKIESTLKIKELAFKMKESLLLGDIYNIGYILDESWNYKKRLSSSITNDNIDEIYKIAKENGAIGGKISGAGGGGFMIFITEEQNKLNIIEGLKKMNCIQFPYEFVDNGLITWTFEI